MTGIGWTDLGSAGIHTESRLFYSTGESGTDDIYVIVSWLDGANDNIYIYVQDDAVGTHRTAANGCLCQNTQFPMQNHFIGDRDCLLIALDSLGADRFVLWAGKMIPGAPGLASPFAMATYCNATDTRLLLRDCDGNWLQTFLLQVGNIQTKPSSPSAFDGLTNVIWPLWARDTPAAGGSVIVGQFQYLYHIDSDYGFHRGDKIPVEDRNYMVCRSAAVLGWFAVRIE